MTRQHGFPSLPATVWVMAALLGTKSILLVQAAIARESGGAVATSPAIRSGPAANAPAATGPDAGAIPGAPSVPTGMVPEAPMPASKDPPPAPIAPAETPTGAPQSPPDWSLLQDLRARRRTLDAESAALDAREAALDAAQHLLEEKQAALQARAAALDSADGARKAERDARFAGMVKLYEAMRPAQAAAIFDGLDMRILLPLLDRMNARKAALVMGVMDPDRARLATQALARYRLGEVPTQGQGQGDGQGTAPGPLTTAASRG